MSRDMNVSRVLPHPFICTPPQAPKEKASQEVRMETCLFIGREEGEGGEGGRGRREKGGREGERGKEGGRRREEKRREGLLFLVSSELLLRDSWEGPIPRTFLAGTV